MICAQGAGAAQTMDETPSHLRRKRRAAGHRTTTALLAVLACSPAVVLSFLVGLLMSAWSACPQGQLAPESDLRRAAAERLEQYPGAAGAGPRGRRAVDLPGSRVAPAALAAGAARARRPAPGELRRSPSNEVVRTSSVERRPRVAQ